MCIHKCEQGNVLENSHVHNCEHTYMCISALADNKCGCECFEILCDNILV